MTAEELLREAEARDVDLWFEGDRLRFRAPHGKLRSDLREELSSRRAEVLEALRTRAALEERTSAPSHNQRGLWLVSHEDPGSASYNIAVAMRILSPLDTSALGHSLQALADRHAALRTTFAIDDDLPVLRIAGAARLALTVHDASQTNEAALRDLVVADYRRPFDLAAGPLVRASLYTSSHTDHVLLFTVHHSVVDGWSVAQMLEELGSLYAEATGGAPASLGRPDAEYSDFVQWQTQLLAGPEGERLWRFWEQALASPREESAFPQDRHRAGPRTSEGGTLTFELDESLCQRLRQLARSEDTTLYVVMLAAFQTLLHRHTGIEDIIVGSPTFGRSRPEFSRVVGNFVNTVPLRTRVQPRETFSALLRKVQRTVHDAIDAQEYPLPLIIERLNPARDAGRSPLFRTAFALQRFDLFRTLSPGNEGDAGQFAGLRVQPYPIEQQQGQFDVVLEMTDRGASIHGDLKYSSDIYDRDTIQAVLHRFIVLLESAVLDPGTPIEALEILPPAERTLLLTEWNRTDAPYPSDTVFVRLFEQQVQRTPQAIAVSSGNARLTYRDLDIGANRLAHRLRELGVVSRSMVGVCLERTPDLLVALLAVQKAGGAYVPLDLSFPVERLRRMVSDSGAHLVVTTASAPGELTDGLLRLDLDAERDRRDRFDGLQAPSVDPGPDDPAYVIYTSGSTGEPNGVAVSHGALVNFLWASRLAPGMSSSDVLGAVASMSFDISGFDFYLPLLVGARIALVDRTTAMDGPALAACFAREKVTTMVSTPSTWRLLLDAGWSGHAQFRALIGGERWSRDLADPLLDRVGELWNLYGPTETTIWSTAERIVKGDGPITIGRPIANTQMYVVDGRGEPVPAGVLGEICVGGAGVAIGYHRREALTAERFVADPFRGQGRLYRTGDLGRWRSDGRLECVGRRDHQVKVRGHRIELGEIDSVLCSHDAVADAVVDAREAPNGDRRLVAYVVLRPGTTLTSAQMAAHLRRSLPDYMVPGPLVILDALPLSPTGKVDRKALPDPATAQADRPYEPPATATERLLSAVWADVLDLPRVGRSDQFFELGGHSILVVSMLQRLGRVGVRVDVRTVFAHPVLADLASAIDMAPAAAATVAGATSPTCISGPPPALSPDDRARIASALPGGEASIEAICPLLPTQHGLLAEHLLDDEGARASYVARATLAFDTRAGLDGFLDAVRTVIARHEALRASLVWEGIAQPVQVIHRAPPLPVLEVESTEVTADAAAVRFLRIDPSRAPLIRAVVHPGIAPGDWRLTLAIHHLITDQTSTMVVMDEVRTILAGGAATLAPAPSYRAQVLSADQSTPLEHETYFRELLGDVDEPTHVFGVADMRGAGRPLGEARICLEADVTSALREAARRHGVTPAVICHVAAAIVVGACSGRDDVVFGTVLLGRSGQAAGADRTVGMFVNALPVRIALADVDLAVAVRNANAQLSALLLHERAPLALAQQGSRVLASVPLFNVLFNYRRSRTGAVGTDGRVGLGAIAGVHMVSTEERTSHAVHLAIDDLGDGLWVSAQAVAGIDAARVASYLCVAIAGVAAALGGDGRAATLKSTVPVRLCDIDVLSPAERQQLLETGNTRLDGVRWTTAVEATLHGAFERWAASTPNALAVADGEHTWTYADLDRVTSRVASALAARGVGREVRVGIALDRSVHLIGAVLGVLKAGGTYVPLDPNYPPDRLAFMVKDSGASLVLSERALTRQTARTESLPIIDIEDCLETDRLSPEVSPAGPEDVAYVIYTSGSTGLPKGVVIDHAAATAALQAYVDRFGMTRSDRWLAMATLSFDPSVLEIFGPLSCGACAFVASRADVVDGHRLSQVIERWVPNYLQATPTSWRMLLEAGWQGLQPLTILVGGETLTADLAKELRRRCTRLFNVYGPTETTVWATAAEVPDSGTPVTIGRPFATSRAYVLDPRRGLAPIGVQGELYIGGVCVGRGYHNRDTLTAERFLPDPFGGSGARMYRTGDAARWRADGELEHLGRLDDQVKVRGHRIELGEIEAALERHPAVRRAAVVVRGEGADQRLAAWLVTSSAIEAGDLQRFLRDSLPEYMIPARLQFLESLPLTPTSKIDRKALPAFDAAPAREVEPPGSDLEHELVRLWEDTLDVRPIGIHDNFFDLGGHSLLAARLCARLSQRLERRVHVATLFQAPTVKGLAERLSGGASPLLAPLRTTGAGVPYFCVPGAGDNAFIFADIARHLGADRPVYSFRFPEDVSASQSPRLIVEGVARRLLEELRSAQPHGPYFLGGYCFGGLVAFDMALALRAAGEEVGALTIFETFLPGSMRMSDPKLRLRYHLRHFQTLGWRDRSSFIAEHTLKRVVRLGRRFSPASATVAAAVTHETDYSPRQVYPGTIALFRARHQPEGLSVDHDMGWKGFATGGVLVHEIEGHHTGAYKEPTVSAWVSTLQETLNAAERRLRGAGPLRQPAATR